MIVNPRGTFGSGKSTIVRRVMDRYDERRPVHIEGRKQPIGYRCVRPDGHDLWVVGHYETACGGGDTIPKIDLIYNHIWHAAQIGYDVIYEGGALIQSDWRRAAELAKKHDLLVVIIDVPVELCLNAIKERRAKRGNLDPVNPKNTIVRARGTIRNAGNLEKAGVRVEWCKDRESAAIACLRALGWN